MIKDRLFSFLITIIIVTIYWVVIMCQAFWCFPYVVSYKSQLSAMDIIVIILTFTDNGMELQSNWVTELSWWCSMFIEINTHGVKKMEQEWAEGEAELWYSPLMASAKPWKALELEWPLSQIGLGWPVIYTFFQSVIGHGIPQNGGL